MLEIITPEDIFEPLSEEEKLLSDLLKKMGMLDPEALKALADWTIIQEGIVDRSEDPDKNIRYELRRAQIFLNAGRIDYAFEALEDARVIAWYQRKDELAESIKNEIKALQQAQHTTQSPGISDWLLVGKPG